MGAMGLDRSARVVQGGTVAIATLPLTPTDFFVLSRIAGTITVAELLHASGLPLSEAEEVLARLVELGAARLEAAPAVRMPASEVKRRALVQQMGAARTPHERHDPLEPSAGAESTAPVQPERAPPPWPLASADDPRLQRKLDLPIAEQRRVLGLVDRLDDLSPYEILGIWPTHDLKLVRRAYHEVSRDFHPDAYFGQELGPFREQLAALFRRATQASEALQDPEMRAPFVDAEIARVAEERRRQQEGEAAKRKQHELRIAQEEAEAAARRHERAMARARRQRLALGESVRRQIDAHVAEATEAEREGKLARAANSWRLALQLHPGDEELQKNWDRCRDLARQKRAVEAFTRAMNLRDLGQFAEAVPLLVEAAEAHGTPEHLAHAAEALGAKDPVRTRNFALHALDALRADQNETQGESKRRPQELARLHVLLARAFLAAGQQATAREQAIIADKHRPGDPEIAALLKSIKLP
jgi:DnaJ-like protein